MRRRAMVLVSLAIGLATFLGGAAFGQDAPAGEAKAEQPQKVYELRIYTTNDGKLPELQARFRDHTMKLFEKYGMENVIYWTITEDTRYRADGEDRVEPKDNTLVYILAHKSRAAADESWQKFRADPEWQAVVAKSEENGPLLANPPQSIFLNPTAFHPGEWEANGKSDTTARLFELRTYNDGEARVPSTVERFRDWEAELFRNSGIETLGFWTKADNSAFVYLLGHKDRETADANWQTFFTGFRARGGAGGGGGGGAGRAGAGGAGARGGAGGQRQGRGGGGGGIERRWLTPTDYSPRK